VLSLKKKKKISLSFHQNKVLNKQYYLTFMLKTLDDIYLYYMFNLFNRKFYLGGTWLAIIENFQDNIMLYLVIPLGVA